MAAGTAYAKRYGSGFLDLPTTTTAIDSTFLNAVEAALLQIYGSAPTVDGQVAQWDNANTRFGPALLLNKNIDPAAAIDGSKLAANIPASKLSAFPNVVARVLGGDGAWPFGVARLFDSTLGADGLTIDTGASGVAQSHSHLLVVINARSARAAAIAFAQLRFNNDSGANYDFQNPSITNATFGGGPQAGQTSGAAAAIPGSLATASLFGSAFLFIPDYTNASRRKNWIGTSGAFDTETVTTTNWRMDWMFGKWRSSAAVSRLAIIDSSAANLLAGSRMSIYGLG